MKNKRQDRHSGSGFTLVEVMVVVAVLALIGGAGYVAFSESRTAARESKLNSDVVAINAAIPLYESSGGSLVGVAEAAEVIRRLQREASLESAPGIIGPTRSFLDRRVAPVFQQDAEADKTSNLRARWDAAEKRFFLTRTGRGGIVQFRIDPARGAAAPATEARETALQFAQTDQWIWDYEDQSPTGGGPGGVIPGLSGEPGQTTPSPEDAVALTPPVFDPPGGATALVDFDVELTITNPNPTGTSQIFFAVEDGSFTLYRGETLIAAPGARIRAFAVTIDPDRYTNSPVAEEVYAPIPVVLQVAVTVPFAQATYGQMGGAFTGAPSAAPPNASATITNLSEIPQRFQSSAYFQVFYTTDGSDPLTSPSAIEGPGFSNGFNPVAIPLLLEAWGDNETFLIRAAARTSSSFFVASTPAQQQMTRVATLIAPPPTITPAGGYLPPDTNVEIYPALGQSYPSGVRVFYTLNGDDPGHDGAGKPVAGQLYTAPINTGGTLPATIRARLYGPAGLEGWFTPSELAATTYSGPFFGEGAFVGSAQLYSTFVGNLIYAPPRAGQQMQNITTYGSSRISNGNLYLPGTPKVYLSWVGASQEWTPARDNMFSDVIAGRHFLPNGVEVIPPGYPPFPRVVDEGAALTPSNYHIVLHRDTRIDGKIFRQNDIPPLPDVSQPPPKDNNNTIDYGTYRIPPATLSSTTHANITLNSGTVQPRLLPGNYGTITANNGTAFVVGDPDNPDVPQVYNIESLRLNTGSDIVVVGKAIINLSSKVEINNGSVLGNINNPGMLQLNFWRGDFAANSGSSAYAQIVAPYSSVYLNNGSIFVGSVTANYMQLTSSSVLFTLPPIIEQPQ